MTTRAIQHEMIRSELEEAVADLKGEPIEEEIDPEINIAYAAYIPEDYIADIDQRLNIYRRLSRINSAEALADMKSEATSRLPEVRHCTTPSPSTFYLGRQQTTSRSRSPSSIRGAKQMLCLRPGVFDTSR